MKLTTTTKLVLLLNVASTLVVQPVRADTEITTEYLAASSLNFTCSVLKHEPEGESSEKKKNIMMLHGFPMFRVWWMPLLEYWAEVLRNSNHNESVHAVACDLRGYSPGASPDNIEEYDYSIFADDTFELASAAGFGDDGFHLLGHDHGAGLAWYVAGNDPNNQVLSLTTLSVPHIDLFSEALCGDNTDPDQVIASNYFNQYSLPDSASANNASLTTLFNSFGLGPLDPESFQKMLWWYNGSLAKHFSRPRVISDAELDAYAEKVGPQQAFFVTASVQAIPMDERECVPVDKQIGPITIPTLFLCGLGDSALLCSNEYATNYPPELLPNYEQVNFPCGHDFFLEGNCDSMETSTKVMDEITSFLGLSSVDEVPNDEAKSSSEETTTSATSSSPATDDDDESSSAANAGIYFSFLRKWMFAMGWIFALHYY